MDDLIEQIVDNWDISDRKKGDAAFWKEIDSHPAFVTELDSNPGNLPTDIEAIQSIHYDDDAPEDSVINYKNEGNYYYRKKTYTLAIVNYTKGLKLSVDNPEMNCILYTNRAACHFHQENYRKCIKDCISAIKMNPSFIKPYWRAAQAASKIDKCDEVLEYCEKGLKICPDNKDLLELKEKFQERKIKKEESKKYELKPRQLMVIEDILAKRGVVVDEEMKSIEIPMQHLNQAYIDSEGHIHFNVLILYPEFGQTDFLQDVVETSTALDCLNSIFLPREKSVDWDQDGHYMIYTPELRLALQTFYEDCDQNMVRFSARSSIRDLITMKQFHLRPDMVVEFNVVSSLSHKFLSTWKQFTESADLD